RAEPLGSHAGRPWCHLTGGVYPFSNGFLEARDQWRVGSMEQSGVDARIGAWIAHVPLTLRAGIRPLSTQPPRRSFLEDRLARIVASKRALRPASAGPRR